LVPVATALVEDSAVGLWTADVDVRFAWLRLLPALGPRATPFLIRALDDPAARVAGAAVEQLARSGSGNLGVISAAFDVRLSRVLAERGTEADPSILHATLDAVPLMGNSAELVDWLATVLDRVASTGTASQNAGLGALHCAAARAFDRVREWPSRTFACGGSGRPAWVGQVAALGVLALAKTSDPLRAAQFKRLYDHGDWHVQSAAMLGLDGLPPDLAQPLVLEGLSSDHKEVRAAAVHAVALLVPRIRRGGESLPAEFIGPLRAAFQEFHVTHDVAGVLGWLSVVRRARLRTELGGVTVLASSGIAPVRDAARGLLTEWGHPLPTQPPEPVPDPVSRDLLSPTPTPVMLHLPDGTVNIVLEPTYAPITVVRVIQWLRALPQALEVSDCRPGHYVRLADATGTVSTAWRSEESRGPLKRGTVVVTQLGRDAVPAGLLILLAPAPDLEGRVAVVGQINVNDVSHFDRLTLGDSIRLEPGGDR
jgi:hypothetical protein